MKKEEIVKAFNTEQDLFDPQENELYMLDVGGEGETVYGVMIARIIPKGEELKELVQKYGDGSITQFALGCIPAPGAWCGNKYGDMIQIGFDGTYNDDCGCEPNDDVAQEEIAGFAQSLADDGIADRLVLAEDFDKGATVA